jgi:hypothetical protein
MGFEQPLLSAVIARLTHSEINLAAYGGIVYPLSLIIESPIIMLLAASTALSKDWASFTRIRRYMMITSAVLTGLHLLIAITPLYYVVIQDWIGAPAEVVEPARIGLILMLPWTWSIAYRRFHQGVLIRYGRSRTVGIGTVIRIVIDCLVLAFGYNIGHFSGVVVATTALSAGVLSEAIYAGLAVRPVLSRDLKLASVLPTPLNLQSFVVFYFPLVLTSLLTLLANPLGSAALSRMPEALSSLAVWSVVSGFVFMLRSLGIALNEVVVALLEEPGAGASLRRFTMGLSVVTSLLLLLITATPLSAWWFRTVSGLEPHLADLAQRGLWIALPLPALSAWQSWYPGAILNGQKTGGISESVVTYLVTSAAVLGGGVLWGKVPGLFVGLFALTISVFTQTLWLAYRSRPALVTIARREQNAVPMD